MVEHIRQTPVEEYKSIKERIQVAKFVIVYYTVSGMSARSETQLAVMEKAMASDIPLVWNLLQIHNIDGATKQEKNDADMLLLDLVGRMQDGRRGVLVFDRVAARPKEELSEDELVALFTLAPQVGRWAKYKEYGNALKSKNEGKGLQNFHEASLQSAMQPDFECLFSNLPADVADVGVEQVKWQSYVVTSTKIKYKKGNSSNPEAIQLLEKELAAHPEGKEVGAGINQQMARVGCFMQSVSTSQIPIPLIGVATNNKFELHGYVSEDAGGAKFKHGEDYVLQLQSQQGKKSVWVGTYTVDSFSIPEGAGKDGKKEIRNHYEFDITMVLQAVQQ